MDLFGRAKAAAEAAGWDMVGVLVKDKDAHVCASQIHHSSVPRRWAGPISVSLLPPRARLLLLFTGRFGLVSPESY